MNTAKFFSSIRESLFGGDLTQQRVNGINAILNAWAKHGGSDQRQLAYVLGTVYHEAGKGMYPVREGFAATNAQAVADVTAMFNRHEISKNYALPDPVTGQSYYGRGVVQITWKGNYNYFQTYLKIPLLADPDLALDVNISAGIAIVGMMQGIFTGKKLSNYFYGAVEDWLNARRIINGMDKAETVAGYAQHFYTALNLP